MAAIVHFSKQDATLRTGTAGGTTAAEVTNYTVAWADLTGAGFANGDDVIVFFKANFAADNVSNNAEATFGRGSTFAGRTVLQTYRTESASADTTQGAREIGFLDRLTLATNDNFYTSIRIITTSTPNIEDYCFFIMKLDDLAADDFRYADATHSGDAPATATDGASVTLPASGGDDWLVLGQVHWLVDSLTEQMHSQLSLGGNVRMTNTTEGEDTAEQFSCPLIGYLAAAANSAVCTVQYLDAGAGTNDVTRTAIFALRMEAFADHVGNMDQDAIAMGGVIDTYVQTNTVSLSLSATGPVAWFAQTIADITALHLPYHRVQVDGADIVAGLGRRNSHAYDITDQLPLTQFGTISMSSGTRVIDVDCAEDITATAYNFDEHTLVAFSMELAAAGPTVRVLQDLNSAASTDAQVMRRARDRERLDTLAVNDSLNRAVIRRETLADTLVVTDFDVSRKIAARSLSDSIDVTDSITPLRLRDRDQLDTSVIDDALNRSALRPETLAADTLETSDAIVVRRVRHRVPADYIQYVSDALWIPEVFSYARRIRNRSQLDTSIVVDGVDATYVPGAGGPVINSRTLQDLNSCAAADTVTTRRLRDRESLDTSVVVDNSVQIRLRDRSSLDTAAVTDAIAPRRLRDRESLDTAATTDESLELRERYRVSFDTIVVLDDKTATYIPAGTVVNNRTLQDLNSCTVTDSITALRLRDRESLDTSVVVDSATMQRLRDRESIDTSVVVDGSTQVIIHPRQLTDSIDVSETQESVRERIRVLSDSITVTDSFIVTASGQTRRTVTDSIDVSDSLLATYVGTTIGQFYISHGVQVVNFEHGLERVHFLTGIAEETV